MATNAPPGDGHRNGMVRKRSQVKSGGNEHMTKRNADTGKFMDVKSGKGKFKGVRKEK